MAMQRPMLTKEQLANVKNVKAIYEKIYAFLKHSLMCYDFAINYSLFVQGKKFVQIDTDGIQEFDSWNAVCTTLSWQPWSEALKEEPNPGDILVFVHISSDGAAGKQSHFIVCVEKGLFAGVNNNFDMASISKAGLLHGIPGTTVAMFQFVENKVPSLSLDIGYVVIPKEKVERLMELL